MYNMLCIFEIAITYVRLYPYTVNQDYLPLSQTHSHLLLFILLPILIQLLTPIGGIHVFSVHVDAISTVINHNQGLTVGIQFHV